ncbi:MAG: fibronectin type III domain-containing protein [Acidimicrobiia bacterium]|nr:fibronectin type III domain-containing protein [Acidimicrobiia bacterium]
MSRYSSMEDSDEAIDALFGAFRAEAFPEGWESAVLDTSPSAPVIRLDAPSAAASIPAPPRVVTDRTAWERHRLTVARIAAAVVFLIGLGGLLSLLPIDEVDTVGDQEIAEAIVTTGAPTPTTAPLAVDDVEPQSTIPGPTVTTGATTELPTVPSTAPPTTQPSTTAPPTKPPTTSAPTSTAPVTTIPTTPSTTQAPPTTVVTVPTSVPITTDTSTTVVTTTPPEPVDIRIRRLVVSKITATSALISFATNDCAFARYQVDGGLRFPVTGAPSIQDCRTLHAFRLGGEPFSNWLQPGTTYQVRITTLGEDGSTDSATINFTTLKE